VQIDGDALIVRDDRLVEDLLREMDVPFAREPRSLVAPFRHAHAPHGHT
jgi:urease accessory protein UreE